MRIFFKKLLFFIVYIPVRIIIPFRVYGKKNLKGLKGPLILASNHITNFDVIILTLANVSKDYYYLGKIELAKNKLLRAFLKFLGVIFIDRSKLDISAMRSVTNLLNNGKRIMIFPEGTRNKKDIENLQDVKGGVVYFATKTDSTIVPVQIINKPGFFKLCRVVIGNPYKIEDSTKEGKDKEIARLQNKLDEIRSNFESGRKK